MPRNGLFADDGRVTDFALYAKNRMTDIENNRTALATRVTAAEGDITILEGNIADEANTRAADVAGLAAQVAGFNTASQDRDNAILSRLTVCGRAAASAGFQSLAGGVAVTLTNQVASGGVTFSAANGGGLTVSEPGHYLVTANAHFSGASEYTGHMSVRRWRSGASTVLMTLKTWKADAEDYTVNASGVFTLVAGDTITLYGISPGTSWGDGNQGTGVSLVRVG